VQRLSTNAVDMFCCIVDATVYVGLHSITSCRVSSREAAARPCCLRNNESDSE